MCGFPTSQCGLGGTWDPEPYQASQQPIVLRSSWSENGSGIAVDQAKGIVLGLTIGGRTVWNATLRSSSSGNITYPNGKVGGVTLGYLSLGADNTKQFFSTSDSLAGQGINASLFAGQLYEDEVIPSYSYGLHIGSAAFDYPGSLVFGGFNKGRVIGPVTSFQDPDSVQLIDIGIGVEYGESPFNFTSKDKLLSGGQRASNPNPLSPYLSLPRQTCENLANLLPITFDSSLKYYVWNTNDPAFAKIVSSPAYISFTFPPSIGGSDNVVIKVPFALLNLTLEAPITTVPTQYFPCVPYEAGTVLGRAFLQAAFIGRNWHTKTSWLAQAPGPGVAREGLGDQNTDISNGATTIDVFTDPNAFNRSWSGHWSVSVGTSRNLSNETTDSGSSNSLSTGAKAGIGVGASLGAIAVVFTLLYLWRKRSLKNKSAEPYTSDPSGHPTPYNHAGKLSTHEHYNQDEWAVVAAPVEVPDTSNPNN